MSIREIYENMMANTVPYNNFSNDLLDLYSLPGALDEWFEIMSNTDSSYDTLKLYACVGLRLIIEKQWNQIEEVGSGVNYLNGFIEILRSVAFSHAKHVIYSLNNVFEKYGEEWPTIFELAFRLAEQPGKVDIALLILTTALPYCSRDFVAERVEILVRLIQVELGSNDFNIVCLANSLFAHLVVPDPPIFKPYPQQFIDILQRIVEKYTSFICKDVTSLSIAEEHANKQADALGKIFTAPIPLIDPIEAFSHLCNLFQNEKLNYDIAYTIFDPMTRLIMSYHDNLRGNFEELIQLLLTFAETRYVAEGTIEDQHYEISELTVAIAEHMHPKNFYELFMAHVNGQTEQGIFAAIFMISEALKCIVEAVEENPTPIVNLLLSVFGEASECIIQASMGALKILAQSVPSICEEYSMNILQSAFPYFGSSEEATLRGISDLFSELFLYATIDTSSVAEIVNQVVELFETSTPLVQQEYMRLFSSAVECSRETSVAFVKSVIPIAYHYYTNEETENVSIRCPAIECFGRIIGYCNDALGEDSDQIVQNMLLLLENEDNLIQKSVLIALKIIIENNTDVFNSIAVSAIILGTINVFDSIYKEFVNSDDQEVLDSSIDGMCFLLRIQTSALLTYKNQLIEFIKSVSDGNDDKFKFISVLESNVNLFLSEDDLLKDLFPLGAALLTFSQLEGDELPEFWVNYLKKLAAVFNEGADSDSDSDIDWSVIQASALNVIADLAEQKHKLVELHANDLFTLAVKTIARDLPGSKLVEDSYRYDPELIPSAQSAIINLINNFPKVVDIQYFVRVCIETADKVSDPEKCIMFGALSCLPVACDIPDEIIQLALSATQLCDFAHSPDPIYFLNQMIIFKPAQIEGVLGDIINFSVNLLQQEPTRDRFYHETIANCASLIVNVEQKFPSVLDLSQIFPLIISKIPYKRDYIEGRHIMQRVISLFGSRQQLIIENIAEIFRGIVVTLSLNEKEFKKYDFPQNDVEAMAQYVKTIFKQFPDLASNIPEILSSDEVKMGLLSYRAGISFE